MSSYAPDYGSSGPTGPLDPNELQNFGLALAAHEGRFQTLPRVVAVPTPAAGVEFTQTVPMGVVWRVLSIRARLVTSAAIADRYFGVRFAEDTRIYMQVTCGVQTSGSQIANCCAAMGVDVNTTNIGTLVTSLPSPSIPLPGGHIISSNTDTLQAADQYSQIIMYVLETRTRTPNERAHYMESLLSGNDPEAYPGLLIGG